MSAGNAENEFIAVLDAFGIRAFSTFDFSRKLEDMCPHVWGEIIAKYGAGGQGAGTHYTAFSSVSQALHRLSERGKLDKLDYRPAPPGWGSPVIRYWTLDRSNIGGTMYPDELPDRGDNYNEGAKQSVIVNRYERNPEARARCIEHYGIKCQACDFDFEKRYGAHGAGFIHVHHLKPLSQIGLSYKVNPLDDLVPVCPNCHAMIHRSAEPLSIDAVKQLLATAAAE